MKNLIPAFVIIASTLFTGCGQKPANSSADNQGTQLTASDLAQLMDFHAWKVPIPESQQPVKTIRLVIVKPDGTVTSKFETSVSSPPPSYSAILLGFRVEHGTFTGHFNTRESESRGTGWNLNFTDPFADCSPAWAGAALVWSGNRAELGMATKQGEMYRSILAIELVK